MSDDWIRDRIGAAQHGENPLVIARMRSGFTVIGDYQYLPGYCVLLAAPQVNHLSDLPLPARAAFLVDMSLLGEAIMSVCQPRRMNYEILGNTDEYLHAHVWPRYNWEPQEYRGGRSGATPANCDSRKSMSTVRSATVTSGGALVRRCGRSWRRMDWSRRTKRKLV